MNVVKIQGYIIQVNIIVLYTPGRIAKQQSGSQSTGKKYHPYIQLPWYGKLTKY